MLALITGASSGMGRDMAVVLSQMGYDLIIVARRKDKLDELATSLTTNIETICCDLSNSNSCLNLYEQVKNKPVDVVINNAGFGKFGEFDKVKLDDELSMINTNIVALHILTKLFAQEFVRKNHGHILNVASAAGFFPGPLMSTYYATKSYVLRYSQAIREEMRRKNTDARISVLCPGPVGTEFGTVANVSFGMGGLKSMDVAKYAIDKMFAGKSVIVPSFMMKTAVFLRHLLSDTYIARIVYHIQKQKCSEK